MLWQNKLLFTGVEKTPKIEINNWKFIALSTLSTVDCSYVHLSKFSSNTHRTNSSQKRSVERMQRMHKVKIND